MKHQALFPTDDWLKSAEHVRVPTRRVSGATLVIHLGRISTGSYQVAVSARVPGFDPLHELDESAAFPNRSNAILFGIRQIRNHWSDVPALVADLKDAEEIDL